MSIICTVATYLYRGRQNAGKVALAGIPARRLKCVKMSQSFIAREVLSIALLYHNLTLNLLVGVLTK